MAPKAKRPIVIKEPEKIKDQIQKDAIDDATKLGKPATPPAVIKEKEAQKDPDHITIYVRNSVPGGPIGGDKRTFSRVQHGEDYLAIAEQYRVRFNGEVVKE